MMEESVFASGLIATIAIGFGTALAANNPGYGCIAGGICMAILGGLSQYMEKD